MWFTFFKNFFKKEVKPLSREEQVAQFNKKTEEKMKEYWKAHDELPGREIQVVSPWGEIRYGKTESTDSDTCVYIRFHRPLILGYPIMGYTSTSESFNKQTGKRLIWGQGLYFDVDDWKITE